MTIFIKAYSSVTQLLLRTEKQATKARSKIFFFCLAFFISAKSVFATPPVILSFPQDIKVDSEFTITATMSGLSKKTVYRLRIGLSKPEVKIPRYFGSTEGAKFKIITTDDKGTWGGEIKGKVDNSDPNYKDKDLKIFDLKLGRYTETGDNATWSEIVKINLENQNPKTSTPTPTKKIQPTPIKTLVSASKTPDITGIPQIQPNPTEIVSNEEDNFESENILATSTSKIIETPRLSDPPIRKTSSKAKYFFIISGLFFLLLPALAFLKKKKDN